MSDKNLISVKELASKLDVADTLLKKFVRDFSLASEKIKNRTHLPTESVDKLKKILKLKAEGKTLKELKAIFVEGADAPNPKASSEEKAAAAPSSAKASGSEEPAAAEESSPNPKTSSEEKAAAPSSAKSSESELENPKANTAAQVSSSNDRPKHHNNQNKAKFEQKQKPRTEQGLDLAAYYCEDAEDKQDLAREALGFEDRFSSKDQDLDNELSELEDDDQDLKIDEDESPEETELSTLNREPRRRKFNFRYVQRQIANDTRQVDYIKRKLRKETISTLERHNLEDALEKRASMLGGWTHILRWIKS